VLKITSSPIDFNGLLRQTITQEDGGVVLFLGVVRRHSEDREVTSLDYEAYPDMALKSFKAIVAEAQERWGVQRLSIVHRTGTLQVGEIAVAVVAASPHRAEAFAACRYAIDRLKEVSPIWKKESLEVSCV
jgi:molybdopterin synthase catalytic subunit